MTREHSYLCSDLAAVEVDDNQEFGTLVFELENRANEVLNVRLPARQLLTLRDTLAELDAALSAPARDPAFVEDDLGEIRPRQPHEGDSYGSGSA
jgi:hypothetical protein